MPVTTKSSVVAALPFVLGLLAATAVMAAPTGSTAAALADWVSRCRSADHHHLRAWYDAHLAGSLADRIPNEFRTQQDAELCAATGGLRSSDRQPNAPGASSIVLVGQKMPMWVRLSYSADGAIFTQFDLRPTLPDEAALPHDLSDAGLARAVDRWIAQLGARGLFSGIVVVARGAEPIAVATTGYADRAQKVHFDQSSQFTIGSLGKMFTAVAIGQLVDGGKLSLEDPVGHFFPAYPNEDIRERATVGMLLSHTAGLGDFLGRRTPAMMAEGVRTAGEFLPLFDHDAPLFPPGTDWSYSNAGFALAGAIIEAVSGESYPDFLRRNVFAAAGMTDSDPNSVPQRFLHLVTPYTRLTAHGPGAEWHEAEHDIGSPAGGAVSTAADLVRFAEALQAGRLVSDVMLHAMATPRGMTPWSARYGYAMEIADAYGQVVVGHGGGFPGVSSHLHLLLGTPYSIVVLSNQDPPADACAGSYVTALVARKAKTEQ